jgi:hypothetical protein
MQTRRFDLTVIQLRASANSSREVAVPEHNCPVEGKKANCPAFGTYEPWSSDRDFARLCHGGEYQGKEFEACPVRGECRMEKEKQTQERIDAQLRVIQRNAERLKAEDNEKSEAEKARDLFRTAFRAREFTVPHLSELPTTNPMASATEDDDEDEEDAVEVADDPSRRVGPQGQFPRAVVPGDGAPPGRRSSYAEPTPHTGELFPTFLPKELESPWKRLIKNIAQGILAAAGFALWNYCRTIDLFG